MTNLCAEAGISFRRKLLFVRSKALLGRGGPRCNSTLHSPDWSPSDSGTESCVSSCPAHVHWVHHVSEPDLLLPSVSHHPWPQGTAHLCSSATAGHWTAHRALERALALCGGCRATPASSPTPARKQHIALPLGLPWAGAPLTLLPFEQSNQVLNFPSQPHWDTAAWFFPGWSPSG